MRNLSIAIIIALLLASCAQQQSTQAQEPIKIGWLGPLTGTAASYGTTGLNAATLAIEDLNSRGGIDGRQIKLVVEDAKCDGTTAVSAANKLISLDNVRYILGGHCSTESLTIIPITEQNGVFIMASTTGANKFTGAGKLAFRTYPAAKPMYGKLAEVAYERGSRKVVLINEQKDWPESVVTSFGDRFKKLGGSLISKESFPPGTTDFRTILTKVKSSDADSIMVSIQGPDTAAIIAKQVKEMGLTQQIYGDSLFASKATAEKAPGALEGAIGAVAHNPLSEKTAALVQRYEQRYGKLSFDPFYVVENYDNTLIVAELIKRCGDDTQCARKEILSQNWTTTATFRFDEQGDANPYIGILQIRNNTPEILQE